MLYFLPAPRPLVLLVLLLLSWPGWAPDAQAQNAQKLISQGLNRAGLQEDTVALNGLYENLEPATQIAPSLLGIGASNVSTPSGLQDVSFTQLNSFARFPKQGSGIGIEFSPVQLFKKTDLSKIKLNASDDKLVAKLLSKAIDTATIKALLLRKQYLQKQYQGLADYRKTFWAQGFTVSGASATDSLASRLALGLSYTFGAGQLDPFKARGFSEEVAAAASELLAGPPANRAGGALGPALQALNTLASQNGEAIAAALQEGGLLDKAAPLYESVFNALLDQVLAPAPSRDVRDTTKLAPLPAHLATAEALRDKINSVLDAMNASIASQNKQPNRPAQLPLLEDGPRQKIIDYLTVNYLATVQATQQTYIKAIRPAFRSLTALVQAKTTAFERDNWNVPLIQVGSGWVSYSPKRTWEDLSYQSTHLFVRASGRLSVMGDWFRQHTLVVMNLQYVNHRVDSVRNKFWYGGRLLVGNQRIRASVEGSFQWQQYRAQQGATRPSDTQRRFTVGGEVRVADNLWLEIAFGRVYPIPVAGANGKTEQQAGLLTLADLKYGFRNHRRFKVN